MPSPADVSLLSPATALYTLGAAVFNLDLKYVFEWESPIQQTYGGQLQFLTILGVIASYLTVTIGLMAHILGSSTLLRLKNTMLMLVLPVEVLIGMLYGGITLIDPTLLFPDNVDVFLPVYVDFGLHGAPAILLLIDFLVFSPNFDVQPLLALTTYAIAAYGYWTWVHVAYAANNFFPYPLLSLVTTEQRAVIFGVSVVLLWIEFFVLRWAHKKG
ncbi:FAR-17a/AIG1-like protein [Limtongia smithiae]|uniref:FAR-17a/AIG1-like protein n=1 Tax=Limtongia smithiae TaxID=1125753 RepID=UPI0034CEE3C5